jgi:hypothetical protein
LVLLGLLLITIPNYTNQKAYADGLTQENLPPASVGNRKASLFVKVNPPILTTDNRHDAYMQFRLFDANNNKTIQHVTYEITITRGTTTAAVAATASSSPSSISSQKPLLLDFFHAHNGLLTVKILPSNGTLTVYGEQDLFLNAWVADPGGTINIKGPLLLDNDRNIFLPQNSPKFDSYLSVGDVYRNKWNYQNQIYNTTLISYYDKVNSLNFDPAKRSFSWTMPYLIGI